MPVRQDFPSCCGADILEDFWEFTKTKDGPERMIKYLKTVQKDYEAEGSIGLVMFILNSEQNKKLREAVVKAGFRRSAWGYSNESGRLYLYTWRNRDLRRARAEWQGEW